MKHFEILSVEKTDYNESLQYKVRFERNNHAFIITYCAFGKQMSEKELEPILRKDLHNLMRIKENRPKERSDTMDFINGLWSMGFIIAGSILIITSFIDVWEDSKCYETIFYKIYKSCLLFITISCAWFVAFRNEPHNSWRKEMDDHLKSL